MSQLWYEAASVRILHRTITHTGIREKGVNVSMRIIRRDTASSIIALDFAFLFNLHLRVFTLCDHLHVLVHSRTVHLLNEGISVTGLRIKGVTG